MYWEIRLLGSRAWSGVGHSHTQLRQRPNKAAMALRRAFGRIGKDRRKIIFPIVQPTAHQLLSDAPSSLDLMPPEYPDFSQESLQEFIPGV